MIVFGSRVVAAFRSFTSLQRPIPTDNACSQLAGRIEDTSRSSRSARCRAAPADWWSFTPFSAPVTRELGERYGIQLTALLLCLGCLGGGVVYADALVVTRAMKSTTIAQMYIEPTGMRIELEVGMGDLPAFKGLLPTPEQMQERQAGEDFPLPRDQQVQDFFRHHWTIKSGQDSFPVEVERLRLDKRVVRDEVTGEPISASPVAMAGDAATEAVLRIDLRLKWQELPQALEFQIPEGSELRKVTIGFVCYHQGVPVNDFRYLPSECRLTLDWQDPWYSKFRNRNLWRQFEAPLSAFLYVEPYEVRQEIVVRPIDLQEWIDLGIEPGRPISVAEQSQIKKEVARFLAQKNPVRIDGQLATGELDRIHFIHRSLRTTGVIEPPEPLDPFAATLGVIFVYPTNQLPQEVTMRWELFGEKMESIPVVANDEAGGLPGQVDPQHPDLKWQNFLKDPTSPEPVVVASPAAPARLSVPWLALLCLGLALVLGWRGLVRQRLRSPLSSGLAVVATLVVALLLLPAPRVELRLPWSPAPELSTQEAAPIADGLLYNVYRAFDHHNQSLVYDRLEQSVSGDLLEDVYLQTRQSMELKNQGGLSVSVKDVEILDLAALPKQTESGQAFQCRWRVAGWVGHWGHIHQRVNEHTAKLVLAAKDGRWKITDLEMLEEQSLDPARANDPAQANADEQAGSRG